MPKIGTAIVELKPVLNEEMLAQITKSIEDAVAEGVRRGMAAANMPLLHPASGARRS